jgi:hypothetical protein
MDNFTVGFCASGQDVFGGVACLMTVGEMLLVFRKQ